MTSEAGIKLHGYWRSTASYRVRIALNLKAIDHQHVTHDLRLGAQTEPEYHIINSQDLVPALELGERIITQSQAIFEWLEENYPSPPLLPPVPDDRAVVRAMAALVCCDIHPLNNLRVLTALRKELAASEEQVSQWISRWISSGFMALEKLIKRHGRGFSFGESPTFADCCLIPQVYSARRFGVLLEKFPSILKVVERCDGIEAFALAAPEKQPDAD